MSPSFGTNPAPGSIWVCGRPRFLRELLVQVLIEKLGTEQVTDAHELEPPALAVPADARWLVWFVNGGNDLFPEITIREVERCNLVLIWSDGRAAVRTAGGRNLRHRDLSLVDLEYLLSSTPISSTRVY
jgi:hypothetical protein